MKQKTKTVVVDGFNLNADHYGSMTREEAITRMKADGFLEGKEKSEDWWNSTYDKLSAALDKAADKEAKAVIKEEKEISKTMAATAKAVEKIEDRK